MSEVSVGELSEMLADDIERVCHALRLIGAVRGRSFVAQCPWSHPKKGPPKLYIDIGNKAGAWIDFRSGETGDALRLVEMVLSCGVRSPDAFRDAMRWTREHFGLSSGPFNREAWAKRVDEARERSEARHVAAAAALGKQRARAKAMWLAAHPLQPHQDGYRYLAARGIDFARLGKTPRAVRMSAQEPYWENGSMLRTAPALLTCMTLEDGSFGSLHKTFVDPARPGEKADFGLDERGEKRPARKMWPESAGCAMRVWNGNSGLTYKQALENGLIEDSMTCEGLEDGLSLALIYPERRIWPAGSLSNLMTFVPPQNTDRLWVAKDNDWDKPAAQKAFDKAIERFVHELGLKVEVRTSPVGKDFNDLIKGQMV